MTEAEFAKGSQLLGKYLADQKIFIVDTAASSRRRLAKTLVDLGAKTSNVILHGKYEEAEAQMLSLKPKVVICDYNIGGRSGLELLQVQRKTHKEHKDSLFVLITGNSSQSAVARAAEEDVDSFILKPYTMNSLKDALVSSAVTKLFPSEYQQTIDQGKELMVGGKLEEAMETFGKAMRQSKSPALACFYYGQVEAMQKALEDAKGSYEKGLSYNQIHYKCLIGLFDLLMQQKEYEQAYEVVRRISKYFPANPKRLGQIIKLAVLTKKYEDIEAYYKVFTSLETRNEELVRYICAGLIVTGRFYLQTNNRDKALEVFNSAAVSAAGRTLFLRKTMEVLAEYEFTQEAKSLLERFPESTRQETDYLVSKFLLTDLTAELGVTIKLGHTLWKQGHILPSLTMKLVPRFYEAKQTENAEQLLTDSIKLFPEEKPNFDRLRLPS